MQPVVNFVNPILRCNVHLGVTFSELLLLYDAELFLLPTFNLTLGISPQDYKKGVVESVRRKKLTLNPYIHNDVPTPLMIGDPRNDENFFVGNVIV